MSDIKPLLSPAPATPHPRTAHPSTETQGKYALKPSRISFPSSSSSALYASEDPDVYDSRTSGYRAVSPGPGRGGDGEGGLRRGGETGERQRPGVPKLSRECLWSEFKCYGSYIFPVIFVFGVLAIGISLGVFGWKKGWFDK